MGLVVTGDTWRAWMPIQVFEKADAPPGRRLKIRGIVSTEHEDRHGDIVEEGGLDFSRFLEYGWFNDNHGKKTGDVLGYPERVWPVEIRESSGRIVKGTAVEGYLVPCEDTRKLVERVQGLEGSGRQMGFSVEGDVLARSGPKTRRLKDGSLVGKRIAKATVVNCAITHCPVNPNTAMELMAKAMTAGTGQPVFGAQVAGSMAALMPESLEGRRKNLTLPAAANGLDPELWKQVAASELEFIEGALSRHGRPTLYKALDAIRRRFPKATPTEGARIYRLAARGAGA